MLVVVVNIIIGSKLWLIRVSYFGNSLSVIIEYFYFSLIDLISIYLLSFYGQMMKLWHHGRKKNCF